MFSVPPHYDYMCSVIYHTDQWAGSESSPAETAFQWGGVITNYFLIGNVFEYLSSCPTHTPHLLFFHILFNLKFVVAGFDFAVYKEFTLNKHFPKKKNDLLASHTLECRSDLKAAAHTVSDCDFKLQEMKCGIVGVWIESLSMCLFLSFLALFLCKTVN